MRVTVEYSAQLKRAAGMGSESFDLDDGATLNDLVAAVVSRHEATKAILVGDDNDGNRVHPSILVFAGDRQIRGGENCELTNGETVAFLSPISGG